MPKRASAKRVRFEVLPDAEGGWSVTRDRVVIGWQRLKAKAVAYGVDRAQAVWKAGTPASLRIKRADGAYQEERTYGEDPFPPKG